MFGRLPTVFVEAEFRHAGQVFRTKPTKGVMRLHWSAQSHGDDRITPPRAQCRRDSGNVENRRRDFFFGSSQTPTRQTHQVLSVLMKDVSIPFLYPPHK